MDPVFEILPEAIFFQQTNLICELSSDSFSYVFESDIDKKIYGLSVFNFKKEKNIAQQLKEIFKEQNLLDKKYKKVFVLYSFAQSALLPGELYKPGENELLLDTLYGDLNDDTILTDTLQDKNIYNVYRIPTDVHQTICDEFTSAVFYHQYSLLVKQNITGDILKVIFYADSFVTVLVKGRELKIIQRYFYQSATDIVYHLLNTCKQFDAEGTPLYLSGMIKEDSELHKEIENYFSNIHFNIPPDEYEYAEGIKAFPTHYFSHLFSVAACV